MNEALHQIGSAVAAIIVGAALSVAVWFGYVPNLGTAIPTPVATFETSLASSITSADTAMTLVATSTKDGTDLTVGSTYGFVIDEGSSNEEFVLGVASSGRRIVTMTRGVSVVTGNTNISDLQKAHRRGASVKITDAPVILVLARIANGDESFPNALSYATSVTTSTLAGSDQNIASVGYVNDTAFAGAPDASTSTKGLAELATCSELSSGTASGGSGPLVSPGSCFNATAAVTTIPVSNGSGKLSQGWLDLTAPWTFSGGLLSSSSSFSGTYNNSANATFSGTVHFTGSVSASAGFPLGLIAASTTNTTVNTSTETAVVSSTIPANVLTNGGVVRMSAYIDNTIRNSADNTLTIRASVAGNTIASTTIPYGLESSNKAGKVTVEIFGSATATSTIESSMDVFVGTNTTSTFYPAFATGTTSSADNSQSQAVTLTFQLNGTLGGVSSVTVGRWYIHKITP